VLRPVMTGADGPTLPPAAEGGDRLARLGDGAAVLVRPLEAGDREGLREGLAALSARTRRLRFHGAGPKPTEADLDLLLDLDRCHRAAWCAVDPASGRGLGVARYVRVAGEPAAAELALAVVDGWQGRGLGRLLLDRLARDAAAAGIERFRAAVLAENGPVLDWVRARGGVVAPSPDGAGGVVEAEVPVAACLGRRTGR
jgi:GNAT superfamily N-acetyltransferase